MTKRKSAKTATEHRILGPEALELVATRFRLLGDPSRLRLLNLLMQGQSSVQDLVSASGLSQANVSRHLGLLRQDGIVGRIREGNRALYRVIDPDIERLCDIACGGLAHRHSQGSSAFDTPTR
ncbi:MAG TPA: ArsR family transcriptional regulator [Myxococcales bacterium]|nr:ArsR family transcriptional regulator [Myxococcales bacterium]